MEFSKVTEGRRAKSFKAIIARLKKSKQLYKGINNPWKEDDINCCCFVSTFFGFCLSAPIKDYPPTPISELPNIPSIHRIHEIYVERNKQPRMIPDGDFYKLEWAFQQKETQMYIFDSIYNPFYLRHLLVIMGIYDYQIMYQAPKDDNPVMVLTSPIGWGLIGRIEPRKSR